MSQLAETITRSRTGDLLARGMLEPLVYDQLRDVAGRILGRERAGHTLQPTALVHEAYLRLVQDDQLVAADRVHLLSICARVMHRILIDHARARRAEKRGGNAARVTLNDVIHGGSQQPALDLLDLHDALEGLHKVDERAYRVVELRFFGGLTTHETATALGVSVRTTAEDWAFARAWLARELNAEFEP